MKDTGTGKTVQLVLFYFIFGSFNIQTDYMFSGNFDSRVLIDWL